MKTQVLHKRKKILYVNKCIESFKFEVLYCYFRLFLQINTRKTFSKAPSFLCCIRLCCLCYNYDKANCLQSRFTVETNYLPHRGEGRPGHLSKITSA